ncbi:MAG: ATP-binding protein [Methylococcales bacterium]|nr:ATP-binding protein [Methylococcales bacterium]
MILKHRSIKTKLIFITALSSILALLVFSLILFTYEMTFAKRDLIHNLQTQAEIISENSLASLAFMDDSTTRKTLGALKHNPDILFAGLYNAQQELLDAYRNGHYTGQLIAENDLLTLPPQIETADFIQITQPIDLHGELLGYLVLRSSFDSFNKKLLDFTLMLLSAFGVTLALALLLSLKLQRIISTPIIRIVNFIHSVTSAKSYNVQAIKENNDEFGRLVDAFNEMLRQLNLSFQQRDEAEQALSHHLKHLREIVDEQTLDLQKALNAADAASHSKSDFLANMSHEIRTPMNAIMGLTQLAQRTELTEKQRDYLEKIETAAQALLAIINDILDFSKIEAGKMTIESTPFSLDKLLIDLLDMLKIRAEQKGISLNFKVAINTPHYFIGDSLRLGQVLLNLLGNAVKFTHKGEVMMSIEPRNVFENEAELCFCVSDTGIGMNEEQLNGLFQPFSQADTSTTRKYGGTGLGLTICKQLVELMGGEIQVSSEEGKGSTFTFNVLLPRCVEGLEMFNETEKTSSDYPTYHTQRILLVEDNEINQQVALELLTSMGLEVSVANNGQEGLARVLSENFDLVLMDIQMPIMDGLSATRLIRQEKHLQTLPIIAMTAHAMIGDKEKSLAAGMNDHLTKPIEIDKLVSILNRWLAGDYELKPIEKKLVHWDLLPTDLPPFDLAKALKFTGDDPKLLHQLLLSFVPRYQNAIAELTQWISEKDFFHAEHLAHSLKGVAGTLAAQELRAAADALEFALHCEQYENIETLLAELARTLTIALNAITLLPPIPLENLVMENELDDIEFSKLLAQFNIALRSNHFNATELFEQIKGHLMHKGLREETQQLTEWLDQLDFQSALPVLDKITLHFLKGNNDEC